MDLLDIGIYGGFLFFAVALIAMILMEAFNLVKDTKAMIRVGMVIVGLAVLFFISYAMSGSEVTTKYTALGVGEGSSKLIGAGLIMLYIFLFVSIAGMLLSELSKIFK